jgi:hypothetical protein
MLAIDIIEGKPYFTNGNTGQSYLDLVAPSWSSRNIRYTIKTIAIVSDETEMRGDLVSLLYMQDTSRIGTLLKLNNISNPLSLKSGEVLFVPGDEMVNDLFQSGDKINNQKQKAKSFRKELQDKISQVSKDRLEYLNSKNISNLAQNPLPPNILQAGEQQILVAEGRLLFGPDIGQCRSKATKNVSVTDIKTKLAQKNIFKR